MRPIRTKLIQYWLDHPNQTASAATVKKALGPEFTEAQIKIGMNNLRSSGKFPGVITVVRGNVWRYEPPESNAERPKTPPPSQTATSTSEDARDELSAAQDVPVTRTRVSKRGSRKFTEIGTTQDGKIIIKDSSGFLYRAEQM